MAGRAADQASALLRWTISTAKRVGQPTLLFFVDIQAAYYTVLHSLLNQHAYNGEELADVLDHVDIPLAYHDGLKRLIDTRGAIGTPVALILLLF